MSIATSRGKSPWLRLFIVVAITVIAAVVALFHGEIISYLKHFWRDAIQWHVNPLIFVGLLFATLYHYYKGWFMIARGIFGKDKSMLLRGAALNRFVWVIPYAYVLVFGHGYPWWVPAGISTWIVVGTAMFLYNYRNQKYVAKMTGSFWGRLVERRSKAESQAPTKLNFWWLQGWLYESLFTLTPHRKLVEETAASLDQVDGRVLDAGCGTGRLSEWTTARVIGIDFSETMLKRARRRGWARKEDLNARLPFRYGEFARVVSLNVLYTLPNPQKTLMELARVLEPKGELILATPTTQQLLPLVEEHFRTSTGRELLVSIINLPRLLAWVVNLAIRGLFEHHEFTFLEEAKLIEMVQKAGLTVVEAKPCYAGIDVQITARKD
ncbi:MAG TPA: methyltransferase domain-containing protein [Candidatus Saccharimonadales bacterium]|nr:methyltransferase domain-containing protein [Candidatus Saccharimonadales bacterium]